MMRTLVLFLLLIPQFALAFPLIMTPVAGYDVAVHCSLSERTQQNDNALVEVNVVYENGTYILAAQISAAVYWGALRLMNQTWTHPLICLTALATQETVFWTIHVNGYRNYRWVWAPSAVGEHQLAYVTYPPQPGNVSLHIYYANTITTTSVPEFPPVAATMTTILALIIVSYGTNRMKQSRKEPLPAE